MREVKRVKSNYDIALVLLVMIISVFGLVMIYSTSSYNAGYYYQQPEKYFTKQGLFIGCGMVWMLLVSLVDYRIYIKAWGKIGFKLLWLLYLLCLGLQLYVKFFGHSAGGSSRWIELGSLGQFQPSEVSKLCIIMFVAYLIQKSPKLVNYFDGVLIICIFMAPIIGLVALENLSSAIIMGLILLLMCIVASKKKLHYLFMCIGLGGVGALFTYFSSYRLERILNWWNDVDLTPGSQILSGLYAIASGGLLGKGLGNSTQKLGYISEVHTDMIFTIVCEELGIFGAIIVITVVLLILWRLFSIALGAPDMFGSLLATGVMIHIAVQMILNIAVVTHLIPTTGIPFPFLSYGVSSLLILFSEMGLALSVSRYSGNNELAD